MTRDKKNMLKPPLATGVGFGLTSGVITTLGLLVGLHAGTHSTLVVAGGVLTIAVADALSDALGIHIAEEARRADTRHIWQATLATFFTKFFMALSFLVPLLLFEQPVAIAVSVAWGFGALAVVSLRLARAQCIAPWKVIGEHLLIAAVVVTVTHLLGGWVAETLARD
jgi:VIT1/CCC1 family predicted Fe2+/Mn2+ transporter